MLSANSPVFAELIGALRERLSVIADRAAYERDPQAHLRQLQSASERITHLQGQLTQPLDPRLSHYLDRCSFDKALEWLELNENSQI